MTDGQRIEADATEGDTDARLPRGGVTLRTVEVFKSMIRRGELRAGDKLPPERDLARLLQISRPTVREAIGALSALGVLEPHHGEGTFVSDLAGRSLRGSVLFLLDLDADSLDQLAEARYAIELGAAAVVAGLDRPVGDMDRLVHAAEAATGTDTFPAAETAVVRRILDAVGNPVLVRIWDDVAALTAERLPRDDAVRLEQLTALRDVVGRSSEAPTGRPKPRGDNGPGGTG